MAALHADSPTDPGLTERLWEGRAGAWGWVLAPILAPAEAAFRGIVALRNAGYGTGLIPSRPVPVPAISVGNLAVGGTGKTPLVRWLVRELLARGHNPGILHGGYSDDEPALHRLWFPSTPVVAERNRGHGATVAVDRGADVVVLDDAFQHRRMRRDLDVVLLTAEGWTPRPRLLPRGPYREGLAALGRAGVVVVTRRRAAAGEAARVARSVREWTEAPVAVAHLAPSGWVRPDGSTREGAPGSGVAVAGIGRPDAFFRQVVEEGVQVVDTLAFRDHHEYGPGDADRIRSRAGEGAIVTTAKDAVKLAPLLADVDLWVLDQAVDFDEGRGTLLKAVEEAIR